MCGIAFYRRNNVTDLQLKIQEDLKTMGNRGPDNSEYEFLDDQLALAHTRLAINGLSEKFNQPYTEDKINYLIFNGEIYNFRDEDCNFDSDTQYLYKNLSKLSSSTDIAAFLNGIDGVWAFVFVTQDTVIVSRDFFGEKPLYQHVDSGGQLMCFSSIDNFAEDDAFETCEFPSNTLRVFCRDDFRLLDEQNLTSLDIDYKPLCEQAFTKKFNDILVSAIERRAKCDVDIACTVSGGLDSSLIAAIISNSVKTPCSFYTVKFDDHIGEYPYIQYLEKQLGLKVHVCNLTVTNYFSHLSTLYTRLPKNINSPSAVAHSLLMQRIKNDGFKVCLDGQGADEYLGGYDYQLIEHLMKKIFSKMFVLEIVKNYKVLKRILNLAMINYMLRILVNRKIQDDQEILCASLLKSPLPSLLSYTDYVSMDSSIEVRTPYLSWELVQFTLMHNPDRIDPKVTKPVLRKLLRKYNLSIIGDRGDKMGYELPWSEMCTYLQTKDGRKYMPEIWKDENKNLKDVFYYSIYFVCLKIYPKQAMYLYMRLIKKFKMKMHMEKLDFN